MLWELRGFVVEWRATPRWKAFCANFLNRIEFLGKIWFFAFWGYCCSTSPSAKFSVFNISKSTTAKNMIAFADLVKVSRKIISFYFWTTNMMKLPHKKFYLSTTVLSDPFVKFVGEGLYPPRTFKCQINAIFPFVPFDFLAGFSKF